MTSADTLLEVTGLKTHFTVRDGVVRAVDGVDLTIPRGMTVCVVGESGCGKSVTARSIMQLVDEPGKIVDGSILWHGGETEDLAAIDPKSNRMRDIRGGQIAMVFQEPMASLHPMYTIGWQLIQAIRLHRDMTKEEARGYAISLLQRVGIPMADQRMDVYPFQLSGGMCQRAMIAMALACSPKLLIADEPTTALDVTTQARILDLIADLKKETGMSVLFITHDLGVVAEIADEVVVMYLGMVVERGSVEEIFTDPKHPYTKALMSSIPTMGKGKQQRLWTIRGNVPHPSKRPTGCPFHPRCDYAVEGLCDGDVPALVELGTDREVRCVHYGDGSDHLPDTAQPRPAAIAEPRTTPGHVQREPLLEVRHLKVHFPVKRGRFGRVTGHVRAVDGVDLTIHLGETLGLVGESGCGKTTLGRSIVRILKPTSGEIRYNDPAGRQVDLAGLGRRPLHHYQQRIRMIFQDPFNSLNPRMTLLQIIGDPLKAFELASGSELEDRVAGMLSKVGLAPEYMRRYPHAFSGGERQRINIARALIVNPQLVVADEPVSALDVSVRAQILNLLHDLQEEFNLTYLFISHDLSVVESMCDRVAVMYLGKIVEQAHTSELYAKPRHPYTEALMSAVPQPDPALRDAGRRIRLADDLPDPANPPPGCYFHTRCHYAELETCAFPDGGPALREVDHNHTAACHFADHLTLTGAIDNS